MSEVKVIVTIRTKDCSKRFIASTMISRPWYIDIHSQIRKVFVFSYLLFLKDMYRFGYISVRYLDRS